MKLLACLVWMVLPFTAFTQPNEPHLTNLKQLTFGGDNAAAYFSSDSKKLSFQSNNPQWSLKCHQVFYLILEEAEDNTTYQPVIVSNGEGRSTSSYYMPDKKKIIYASTFKTGKDCPPEPRKEGRYLWPVHSGTDIFIGDEKAKIAKQLTSTPGYDAEAAISPLGDKIVFTSMRNGDLDLYIMDASGRNVKQLTYDLGYEGGAFFSPDGKQLVFQASRPQGLDTVEYKELLGKGLIAPNNMEVYTINIDGTDLKQITRLGKSNMAPFFHPGGNKIIFSSNHLSEKEREFQVFMINTDGSGLQPITNASTHNAFPAFSPDGKRLVFSSNRNNAGTDDINLFVADWVE